MTAVTATRFSLAEYHPLGELGFFGPDDRVEWIGPEITIEAVKSTLQSVCNSLLVEELIIITGKTRSRARTRGDFFDG